MTIDFTVMATQNTEVAPKILVDNSHKMDQVGFLQYLAAFVWVGWFVLLPVLLCLTIAAYFYSSIAFVVLVAIISTAILYPLDRDSQPAWGYAFNHWLMLRGTEYFGLKVIAEDWDALNSVTPAIMCLEPHDVLPVTFFAFANSLGYFGKHKMRGCVSGAIFNVPFMRHIYTWAESTSVDRDNIRKILSDGGSPALCPGGAQEVIYLDDDPNEVVLFLKSRLGIVKFACEFGAPLVPVYAFNQRSAFNHYVPKASWVHDFGRKIGFIPLFFLGVFNIPFAPPKSNPMVMVIGRPIPVEKIENPSREQLESYQAKLIDSYVNIHNKYKSTCGQSHMNIRVI